MSNGLAGAVFIAVLALALAVCYKPLGDYMYRVVTSTRHLRIERIMYRAIGVNPDGEQSWGGYARSVLAFSVVSILFLYAFMRVQHWLWLSLGFPNVFPSGAWNTAVSFVTNTNWQWYYGESTMGHLVQMAGLAVQNFVSAAVGIAVAVALVRGFARNRTSPAAPSPARRPSRTWVPTAAARTTPTRRTRSRTRRPGPTGWRSSCCW
jgi:potassium-transporting ATPase potassium-binding subunit